MSDALLHATDIIPDGGEMGARVRAKDWSSTPLGPVEAWPPSLRAAVNLILASPIAMVVLWGPELVQIYNDGYATMVAAKHPTALGQPTRECWPEVWHFNAPIYEAVRRGETRAFKGQKLTIERHGRPEDAWFDLAYSPLRDDPGTIAGVLVVVVETTSEIQAAAALSESEARFRNLVDHVPVMIWVTGPDGSCSYLNRCWYEFTGQTPGEAEGDRWLDAVHPEDRRGAGERFLDANMRRKSFRLEYRLRRADGEWRWAIDAAAPRFGADGEFLGYVGSVIDITERKRNEERLRLLASEVDHRAKNVLALAQVMIRQTHADTVSNFVKAALGRLHALARAHTLLSQNRWDGAELTCLIEEELAPFRAEEVRRVNVAGPSLTLPPRAAQSIAMALHELSVNAAKYGALSTTTGKVEINWSVGMDNALELRWIETGGPRAALPERKGFGTAVIEQSIQQQLGGEAEFDWRPDGLHCVLRVPANATAHQEIGHGAVDTA